MLGVAHSAQDETLRIRESGTYADVAFFMLDDEYTAMVLLPERDKL